jgi:hypothetical protein
MMWGFHKYRLEPRGKICEIKPITKEISQDTKISVNLDEAQRQIGIFCALVKRR